MWVALSIVAHTLLGVRSYFWYYVPFAPVLALLAGDGVAAVAAWLMDGLKKRRFAGLAAGLFALALALAAFVPAATAATVLTQPPIPRRREQAYLASASSCANSVRLTKTHRVSAWPKLASWAM